MSTKIINAQYDHFCFAYALLCKFVEECPDTIWGETFGGWPVWQQLYHSLHAIGLFSLKTDDAPLEGLFEPEVARLGPAPATPPSKSEMMTFAGAAKAKADAYFKSLSDGVLATKNAVLAARMGRDLTHAGTVVLLSAHTLYHLGSCDAALRQHGLKGVF